MENRIIDPVTMGKRLRILRGIETRAKVSRDTGLSQSRLGNYEHGIRMPGDDTKALLANYYGVTVQELFYTNNNNETL